MIKGKPPAKPVRPSIICSRCNKSFPLMIVDKKGMLVCRDCLKWMPLVDSVAKVINSGNNCGDKENL